MIIQGIKETLNADLDQQSGVGLSEMHPDHSGSKSGRRKSFCSGVVSYVAFSLCLGAALFDLGSVIPGADAVPLWHLPIEVKK